MRKRQRSEANCKKFRAHGARGGGEMAVTALEQTIEVGSARASRKVRRKTGRFPRRMPYA